MSDISFDNIAKEANIWITPELKNVFSNDISDDITVKASMYSLMAGGKRIRPLMMLMTAKMFGADDSMLSDIRYYAATLEMIHTYSLIHDDLPAMDNDDLRRGMPTCHKAYGEDIAILAGDCLLNSAMERLLKKTITNPEYAFASYKMAYLSGIYGMIGGQSIDLDSEGKKIELEKLYELQDKKTGALIEAAVVTPYYLINKTTSEEDLNDEIYLNLKKLSKHIGLAFQIKDDLLDVDSSSEELGKSVGKDERDNKSTFVTLLGYDGAINKLNNEIEGCFESLGILKNFGLDIKYYEMLVDFLVNRKN